MPLINFAAREINYKIVYYGCGLCGKTTNIQYIHRKINPDARGKLVTIATKRSARSTLTSSPSRLGTVNGMKTRFHLYTVPGQSYYNASRQLVLQGVDGVIFVRRLADHTPRRERRELPEPLGQPPCPGRRPYPLGFVIQMNKRDLTDIFSVRTSTSCSTTRRRAVIGASAIQGVGVFDTLKTVCKQVIAKTA